MPTISSCSRAEYLSYSKLFDTSLCRKDGKSVKFQAGEVAIRVRDSGPGIDTQLREQVFVPFFTTKQQGTGVGLTLVRQIANLDV